MREEIISKLRDTFEFAKDKTKKVATLSRLRAKALEISSEIKREYRNLGEIVYECKMSGFSETEAVDSAVNQIASLRKQLTELKKEIDSIMNGNTSQTADDEINSIKDEIEAIRRDISNLTIEE